VSAAGGNGRATLATAASVLALLCAVAGGIYSAGVQGQEVRQHGRVIGQNEAAIEKQADRHRADMATFDDKYQERIVENEKAVGLIQRDIGGLVDAVKELTAEVRRRE